jgi:hypothetical protein
MYIVKLCFDSRLICLEISSHVQFSFVSVFTFCVASMQVVTVDICIIACVKIISWKLKDKSRIIFCSSFLKVLEQQRKAPSYHL